MKEELEIMIEDYKRVDYMLCTEEEILRDKVKKLESILFKLIEIL